MQPSALYSSKTSFSDFCLSLRSVSIVYVQVHVQVCPSMWLCRSCRGALKGPLCYSLSYSLRTGSLTEPEARLAGTSPVTLLTVPMTMLALQTTRFFCRCWDLNASPHACTGVLTQWPISPTLPKISYHVKGNWLRSLSLSSSPFACYHLLAWSLYEYIFLSIW